MARLIEYRTGDVVLDVDSIARIVILRGSPSNDLDAIAVALALAESGGHTAVWAQVNAPNSPADGSWDRGLWQINSHWHPEVSDAQAADPNAACDATYRISSGFTNFSAWSAYTNGSYKKFMPQATDAINRHAKPKWWQDWWNKSKPTVKLCSKGWEVAYLQDVLRVAAGQPGATTGTFNSDTEAGVRNLQAFFGLVVDGVCGQQTWGIVDFIAKMR